ncbi:DsbA family protein [Chitinophaga nivalis]|uniref:Protein-disulfide isomerase n=1 Tax=Chitinophaga nivalis TaxID=2991709 RepID=A0ABT3IGR9_9BACT|nr:hypothetical protein [Chitinophaga nivalis]MCW3467146.1 hypothetical protein [Chitinophaga nivalis]MCW3483163.1 hypothetical protein [Chitinophaga nivalis]
MKLIYIMDPLCGWCYGNYPNTLRTAEKYQHSIPMEIVPGGMWAGANVRRQSKQMAAYFRKHDEQIAALTGTAFGEAYFQFITDENILLDSEVPSRAIVTVQQHWPDKSVAFAAAVQKARYADGKDLNETMVYEDICTALDIDTPAFLSLFPSAEMKAATQEAFRRAAGYAMSYPTLLLEKDGKTFLIEQGYSTFEEVVGQIEKHLSNVII